MEHLAMDMGHSQQRQQQEEEEEEQKRPVAVSLNTIENR
jgi:hypothetical protein